MKLYQWIKQQPLSIKIAAIWVLIALIVMEIIIPWFSVIFLLAGSAVLSFFHLIIYFVMKNEKSS